MAVGARHYVMRIGDHTLGTISDLAVSSVGDGTATLTWTAPANATSQQPQRRLTGGSTWTSIGSALSGTAETVEATGLVSGSLYDFRVVASDGTNASYSNTATGTPQAGGTSAPAYGDDPSDSPILIDNFDTYAFADEAPWSAIDSGLPYGDVNSGDTYYHWDTDQKYAIGNGSLRGNHPDGGTGRHYAYTIPGVDHYFSAFYFRLTPGAVLDPGCKWCRLYFSDGGYDQWAFTTNREATIDPGPGGYARMEVHGHDPSATAQNPMSLSGSARVDFDGWAVWGLAGDSAANRHRYLPCLSQDVDIGSVRNWMNSLSGTSDYDAWCLNDGGWHLQTQEIKCGPVGTCYVKAWIDGFPYLDSTAYDAPIQQIGTVSGGHQRDGTNAGTISGGWDMWLGRWHQWERVA